MRLPRVLATGLVLAGCAPATMPAAPAAPAPVASVHAAGMPEALRDVYGVRRVVDELLSARTAGR